MFRFVIESHSFRKIALLTIVFASIFYLANKIFDHYWKSKGSIPLVNLNQMYSAPQGYDNINRINLKIIKEGVIAIEGNRRFRLLNQNDNYTYLDSFSILPPDTGFYYYNRIFLQFENSDFTDSLFIAVSRSSEDTEFYNQVFYSSVTVNKLNELSGKPEEFRISDETPADISSPKNNDSLINEAFSFFNNNVQTLGLAECGRNSSVFKNICDNFNVPCRIIWLQGGDDDDPGLGSNLGYPLHVICEVYSSEQKKWYVIDPTYGIRFKNNDNNSFMSAVELSVLHSFNNAGNIEQDSILVVKKNIVGKDYFKYYENVMFSDLWIRNSFIKKLFTWFYSKFEHRSILYSNNYPYKKNGYFYFGLKTLLYFIIIIFYIQILLLIITQRLYLAKKP